VPRARVHSVDVRASRAEVLRVATESPFTRLPVVDGSLDRIIGLLHARDLAPFVADPGKSFETRKLLRQVLYVGRDLPADELLSRMREARRQVAVVIDDNGSNTLGIVSVDDILDALLGEMADDLKETSVVHSMREARGG